MATRGRGRPTGAVGVFKAAINGEELSDGENRLHDLVMKSLPAPLRDYYKKYRKGDVDYDPLIMHNICMRYVSFFTMEAFSWAWNEKSIPMELSKIASEARLGHVALDDMKRKRTNEEAARNDINEGRMVDPASDTIRTRFEALVEKHTI